MSDVECTPGPWRVGTKSGANCSTIYDANDLSVAQVFGAPMHARFDELSTLDRQRYATPLADAFLIAAAPSMRDTLLMAEYAIRVWDVDRNALSEEGLMKAHKAIVLALASTEAPTEGDPHGS